ncbi:hypothetical protein B0T17DRAFT_589682 [Bombardia bombarda]|uniref:Uncharacterized protein n=1 Tax=Bombardia bombarda TaxID=252184 RepID=A0AA39X9Z9_9PEZI|nr:hypothetical protein B0T17DRAFT_589682 [Bombardia bombarda]
MASMSQPRSLNPDGQLPIVLVPDNEEQSPRTAAAMRPETDAGPSGRHRKPDYEPPKPQLPPAPQHPIPSMQDAFAESLIEATKGGATQKPKLRTGDAKARRDELLDQGKLDGPPAARWRFRPGQRNHELRRLMAQISFGVYLLLNGMANSQISVVSILQGHIDEVDEYLETTLEDIALATKDLDGRIDHLKLPLSNVDVFERMLEDRNFRLRIIEGNQKIEHIVARTDVALQQTMRDLSEGVASTREFTAYLAEQQHGRWRQERPDVIDIFNAMKGNTDGWLNAFIDLQSKGNTLDAVLNEMTAIISEIERRAGKVSRRTRFSIQPFSSPAHSPRPSDASSSVVTTPPTSPGRIQNSPPQQPLRYSNMSKHQQPESPIMFEISMARESVPVFEQQQRQSPREAPILELSAPDSEEEQEALSPPARNPRRLSDRPVMIPQLETPDEQEEDKAEETLFILQPRTYTPQPPPSPLPSPFLKQEQPKPKPEPVKAQRAETPEPPEPPESAESPESPAFIIQVPTQQRLEPIKPRVAQQQLRPQASKPKLVAITPKLVEIAPRLEPRTAPRPAQRQESSPEPEPEAQPKQRTSLRQRVSLKTAPPEAIIVPPHDAPELHRPVYPSPRHYQAPDSAYGSDMERPPVNSTAYTYPSINDFTPPVMRPALIPSPHSDQQYFRPVQASPHSPLQQRPHTSGNASFHTQMQQQPPRNTPSAMGMSMLSNVTTMTNETGSTRALKKKRSAFGWLKKAFSLDEEERAAFEQKRREQTRNLYYDNKSPQFLDGRRIQPRPGYQ